MSCIINLKGQKTSKRKGGDRKKTGGYSVSNLVSKGHQHPYSTNRKRNKGESRHHPEKPAKKVSGPSERRLGRCKDARKRGRSKK